MKFIIYVAGRIRNGQRVGLSDFPYSEAHGKYIYQGRELTLEDFNAAAEAVFQPNYRNNGYTFCPLAIDPKAEAAAAARIAEEAAAAAEAEAVRLAEEAKAAEEDAQRLADEEKAKAESSASESSEEPRFRLVENDIFMGDERVARIYENGLRCSKGFADLREELEAWLETLNPSDQ